LLPAPDDGIVCFRTHDPEGPNHAPRTNSNQEHDTAHTSTAAR
jgi:hypothetical protein